MPNKIPTQFIPIIACFVLALSLSAGHSAAQNKTRVFIFAGQSNMVGSDAHAKEIDNFPMFKGAGVEQPKVKYRYIHGEDKPANRSLEWIPLQPDKRAKFFGPELTFARTLNKQLSGRIAIVKSAWGGTTLAKDWDPDNPSNKDLFARTMRLTRDSLKNLKSKRISHELSGFFWHQGENDMLSQKLLPDYGQRLEAFIKRVRKELEKPNLPFFVGEISDKGIWGLDNRRNMQQLRAQQRAVCEKVKGVYFVETSHLAFKVTKDGHPHYHFGTEGQLQHGMAYARAYLSSIGESATKPIKGYGKKLPAKPGSAIRVFLVAGQRSAEGDHSYAGELGKMKKHRSLASPQKNIPFRYFLGGGAEQSQEWIPLQPASVNGYFGPELSLGKSLDKGIKEPIVILKITNSAAMLKDWLPESKDASRPQFKSACDFVKAALKDLKARGYRPRLDSLFWIPGEHDTFWGPFRKKYSEDFAVFAKAFRRELKSKKMKIYVSEVPKKLVWGSQKIAEMNEQLSKAVKLDRNMFLVPTTDVPCPEGSPSFGTLGSVALGKTLAKARLKKK
ncbi:MAG: hypothetical protein ACI97A_003385 [Planctomycetota bacterium]|jgi:hypothetical protein